MDMNLYQSEILFRFFWNGYTYLLRRIRRTNEIELIMFLGQIHDMFTKIEKTINEREHILNFLISRNVPMNAYLEIEKVFLDNET